MYNMNLMEQLKSDAIKPKYHGIVSAQNSLSFSSLESQLYNDVVQIYYDSSDDWRRYYQE